MENKTWFVEELDRALRAYCDEPNENGLYAVWCALLEGIERNYSLPCPARLEEDKVSPLFFRMKDGREHLAVLTRLDADDFVMVAEVKLQSIMRLIFEVDECDGILLNPDQDNEFFLPRRFLAHVFSAGYAFWKDSFEKEAS